MAPLAATWPTFDPDPAPRMSYTPAMSSDVDRQIVEYLEPSEGPVRSRNLGVEYDRLYSAGSLSGPRRWVGRCKKCGQARRLEGEVRMGHRTGRAGSADYVVVGRDGQVYTTAAMGSDHSVVQVRCGDHWSSLRSVVEGTKRSKHECGTRCTSATGPSCDCRCRGQNHGRDL